MRRMDKHLRPSTFEPPRRRWPGVAAAALVGLAIAAAVVASWTDIGPLLHLGLNMGVSQEGLWLPENDISAVFVAAV